MCWKFRFNFQHQFSFRRLHFISSSISCDPHRCELVDCKIEIKTFRLKINENWRASQYMLHERPRHTVLMLMSCRQHWKTIKPSIAKQQFTTTAIRFLIEINFCCCTKCAVEAFTSRIEFELMKSSQRCKPQKPIKICCVKARSRRRQDMYRNCTVYKYNWSEMNGSSKILSSQKNRFTKDHVRARFQCVIHQLSFHIFLWTNRCFMHFYTRD